MEASSPDGKIYSTDLDSLFLYDEGTVRRLCYIGPSQAKTLTVDGAGNLYFAAYDGSGYEIWVHPS